MDKEILFRQFTSETQKKRNEEVLSWAREKSDKYVKEKEILFRNFDTGGTYYIDPLGWIGT